MSAGDPFLGALGRSGRAFVKEPAENTPRTTCCTEKRLEFQNATKHSLWRLAGVQATAFSGTNRSTKTRHVHLQVAMLLALIVYVRRAHPSGRAVCLLGLRKGRFIVLVAGLVLLTATAGVLSPYAGSAVTAVLLASLLPGVISACRARAANSQLKRLTPSGRYIYVHSVASTLPGAGAELLTELIREKDEAGCSLALDASNEKLTMYYARFGFVAQGKPVKMPDGGYHTRMWRPADAEGGRRNDRQ